MKRIQFIDRMAQGKMSRRQMLSSAGAFGVGTAQPAETFSRRRSSHLHGMGRL